MCFERRTLIQVNFYGYSHLMTFNLSDMFDQLEMSFSMGDWFFLNDEKIIKRRKGIPFSSESKSRPTILFSDYQDDGIDFHPNRLIFPRSALPMRPHPNRVSHAPHRHQEKTCRITKKGWVCFHIPCTTKSSYLSMETYFCDEPADSEIIAKMKALKL